MSRNRRDFLHTGSAFVALSLTGIVSSADRPNQAATTQDAEQQPEAASAKGKGKGDALSGDGMQIQYLEIVTTDVEATCRLYSKMHGVTFGTADQSLGNARTARLANGGTLGIRAPMHGGERPVVRPYILVKNIEAAVAAAAYAGAVIAVPPMKIAGHGTCAILIQNGIESGLWQL